MEQVITQPGLKTIGDYAFKGCYKLKRLELWEGLIKIGKKAFNKCDTWVILHSNNEQEIARVRALLPDHLKKRLIPKVFIDAAENILKRQLLTVFATPEIHPLYVYYNNENGTEMRSLNRDVFWVLNHWYLKNPIYLRLKLMLENIPWPTNEYKLQQYTQRLQSTTQSHLNAIIADTQKRIITGNKRKKETTALSEALKQKIQSSEDSEFLSPLQSALETLSNDNLKWNDVIRISETATKQWHISDFFKTPNENFASRIEVENQRKRKCLAM